ncbi:hypothetical protein GGH19_001201 [Coemansia sp. RSA 1807]|nr:hypothetical protein LPJ58_004179 [Coemansia sp. RSA 1591]KAJ2144168.1 hypothetical protein IW142_003296 [Coemansia sp. RSA 564]KAJ2166454.1 hypothetical protein GGH15_002747 [Coemansia sp. RSA 562]KAJ2168086.1 hypothetical protein GGF45_005584 [Coemansia sp. RSA 551]KAJ2185794.1 hypothetical protein EV181_003676 [Coemansia sp. RSA 532]KAJ2274299.1 hypothetical protein GGH14_004141 [Coemansia sp. RSA 370]KAJ2431286.1 hypothetical protein IWW41_002960 [Coemansia sp. RSA 2522]KAJ2551615.1 h
MSLWQKVRDNKRFVIGLVVTPVGLYTGIRIKEWRTERKVTNVQREVQSVQQPAPLSKSDDIRAELDNLRQARAALIRQESLLTMEQDAIWAKQKRLDAQDAKRSAEK